MRLAGNTAEDTCLKNRSSQVCPVENLDPIPTDNHEKCQWQRATVGEGEKGAADADENGLSGERGDGDDFPEGGLEAWLVVAGSFCAMLIVFGVANSTAAFQEQFSTDQLKDYSPEEIGWIFSVELFLVFFCGIQVGPIFDAHGGKLLVFLGSVSTVLSMMLLGFCTKYWHFMMVYAVLGGVGGALCNTPAYAAIGHYFKRRRGFATGLACTAGSIGGIIIPIMLQNLIPKIGFAWSTRVLGFLFLALAVPANLFIRTRLPPSGESSLGIIPDLSALQNPVFALLTAGIFLMEWGLFVPLTYISSYAVANGQSVTFAANLLAILNAGSFFGRWIPGLLADMFGRFNLIIVTISLCMITLLAFWLPAGSSTALMIVFAVTWGFASGSNLGLIPVCLGQLCTPETYGKHFSTAYLLVSFGTLTSVPIGGQLLSAAVGNYWGLIVFSGVSYAAALTCFTISRVLAVGWNPATFF